MKGLETETNCVRATLEGEVDQLRSNLEKEREQHKKTRRKLEGNKNEISPSF